VSELLSGLAGAVIALVGAVGLAIYSEKRTEKRWRRDSQLAAATNLLASLQALIRNMIDYAYLPDKRQGPTVATVLNAYSQATIVWNSAMYQALLVSSRSVAEMVVALDVGVDSLLEQAQSREWSRGEFRQARLPIGRDAARYLNTARAEANLPQLQRVSIWTWDAGQPL
jgi:hypothetical protein